jgi:transposase
MQEVLERLGRIETALNLLVQRQTVKDFYSTDEVAEILKKAEFTVREWCRRGRIRAQKRRSGRGKHQSWAISHAELQRIQCEGLLPEN